MCVTMKPRRNEEAQAHIGLSSHRKKKHMTLIVLINLLSFLCKRSIVPSYLTENTVSALKNYTSVLQWTNHYTSIELWGEYKPDLWAEHLECVY
jgi:hypothetical protein